MRLSSCACICVCVWVSVRACMHAHTHTHVYIARRVQGLLATPVSKHEIETSNYFWLAVSRTHPSGLMAFRAREPIPHHHTGSLNPGQEAGGELDLAGSSVTSPEKTTCLIIISSKLRREKLIVGPTPPQKSACLFQAVLLLQCVFNTRTPD